MIAALLLLVIPFDQDKLDHYVEHDRTVLVQMEPAPELSKPFVRFILRKFNVVRMEKDGGDCAIGVYNKDFTVKIHRGRVK